MTGEVICAQPSTTYKELVRLLATHHIRRMPVVDASGRLVGIVSHSDVLKIFLRLDTDIRHDVLEVVFGGPGPAPERIQVSVRDGVVFLEGVCQRRSHIPVLVRAVTGVEGVVRVEDRLSFDLDDKSLLPYTFSRPLP